MQAEGVRRQGACRQRDCASSVNMQAEGVCRQCEYAGRGSVQAV